jgi:hypothetical protein
MWETSMSQQPPRPDIHRLVEIANELADVLRVGRAPEAKVREKLDEILFERGAFESASSGIITEDELVRLVLEHLHTLLSRGTALGPDPDEDSTLNATIHAALFGVAPEPKLSR